MLENSIEKKTRAALIQPLNLNIVFIRLIPV